MANRKFFTREVKIALAFIAALAVLIYGINFLKGINIFTPTNHYIIKYENADGLVVSNGVYIKGYKVGQVRSINYDFTDPVPFTVDIAINKDIRLPRGTVAYMFDESIMGGKAVNLDPYINNPTYGLTEEDKADYIEAFMAEGQEYSVEGTYSLPYSKSTEAMYYNRALLKDLDLSGIDPTINNGNPLNDAYFRNLTWDELFNKLCPALITLNDSLPADQKLLDFDANENVGIFGYDSDDNLFITLAQQYGYGYTGIDASGRGEILFNNDGMKELLTDFNSWARKRYIVSQGTTGSYTSNLFTAQQCLFSVSSTAGVGYLYNESTTPDVGVAPIPQAGGDHAKAQISQGPSFAVLDHGNDNQKLGAWIAYKFLTTPETCIDWSISTGYMGIRDSFYESEQYATASDTAEAGEGTAEMLNARNWEYYLTVTDNVFTSPVFKGSATVRDVVGGLMTQALNKTNDFSDKATLDRFFNDAENQAKNAL